MAFGTTEFLLIGIMVITGIMGFLLTREAKK
jgi:hypothetical protein